MDPWRVCEKEWLLLAKYRREDHIPIITNLLSAPTMIPTSARQCQKRPCPRCLHIPCLAPLVWAISGQQWPAKYRLIAQEKNVSEFWRLVSIAISPWIRYKHWRFNMEGAFIAWVKDAVTWFSGGKLGIKILVKNWFPSRYWWSIMMVLKNYINGVANSFLFSPKTNIWYCVNDKII